jgi:hypothetical protein
VSATYEGNILAKIHLRMICQPPDGPFVVGGVTYSVYKTSCLLIGYSAYFRLKMEVVRSSEASVNL